MNREEVYDSQISPHMAAIVSICKEHDIPLVASFQLDDDRGKPDLHCTTAIIPRDGSEKLKRAWDELKPRRLPMMQITTTKADGSKVVEMVVGYP